MTVYQRKSRNELQVSMQNSCQSFCSCFTQTALVCRAEVGPVQDADNQIEGVCTLLHRPNTIQMIMRCFAVNRMWPISFKLKSFITKSSMFVRRMIDFGWDHISRHEICNSHSCSQNSDLKTLANIAYLSYPTAKAPNHTWLLRWLARRQTHHDVNWLPPTISIWIVRIFYDLVKSRLIHSSFLWQE